MDSISTNIQDPAPLKSVLTLDEAAQLLGLTKSYLYKLTSRRLIPHYKAPSGRTLYFSRRELEEWMTSVRVATSDELDARAAALCM